MQYGLTDAQVARIRTGDIIGNRMWPELTFRVLKPAYRMDGRYQDRGIAIEAISLNGRANQFVIWGLPSLCGLLVPQRIALPEGV